MVEREFFATARPTSVLQRFETPDEIAALIAFVCSAQASAITRPHCGSTAVWCGQSPDARFTLVPRIGLPPVTHRLLPAPAHGPTHPWTFQHFVTLARCCDITGTRYTLRDALPTRKFPYCRTLRALRHVETPLALRLLFLVTKNKTSGARS